MKIKEIRYKNFKGLKDYTFIPNGKNANVYGDNATYKSTLQDGWQWLLFGKDSLNQSDFNIKPIDQLTGEDIHGLETEVKAVIQHKGIETELKKVYYEKWTKSRGETEKTFSGNTTDYYIDDVPVKKKEYDEHINSYADEQTFKLLTNPLYANEQMHWTALRELLITICGSVEQSDIFLKESKLKELEGILSNRTIEDHIKVLKAQRKKLNDDIEKIPTRIDEVILNKPDISSMDFGAIENRIKALTEENEKIRQSISDIQNGSEIGAQNVRLAENETNILRLKNKYQEGNESLVKAARDESNKATDKYEERKRLHARLLNDKSFKESEIDDVKLKLKRKSEEWREENNKTFHPPKIIDTCYACGQKLPDKGEFNVVELEKKSNILKSQRLEDITKGVNETLVPLKAKYEEELKKIDDEIVWSKRELEVTTEKVSKTKKSYEDIKSKQVDVTESEEYKALMAEKENINAEILRLKSGNREKTTEHQNELYKNSEIKTQLQSDLAKKDQHEKALERIEVLKAEEKEIAKKLQGVDKELYLTDLYIKTQVSLLDAKINSKFKYARFKLFNTLVNGGVEACAECTYKGVPYSSMNNAARINAGIDIINTISEYYDFTAPIFCDNAEAVTKYIDTNAQLIKLIVSEKDKSLRVLVEGTKS